MEQGVRGETTANHWQKERNLEDFWDLLKGDVWYKNYQAHVFMCDPT